MIEGKIAQANGRLKVANVGVRIEQKGNHLYLRATLPPKPDSDRIDAYQQRIALGIYASGAGLSAAEAEARKIGALLACKEFNWSPYLKINTDVPTVSSLVTKFETDYFSKRERSPKTETTYQKDYLSIFRKLPSDELLTRELMLSTILGTDADTKTRKRCCMVLGALAQFAGIEFDAKPYSGKYSPREVTPRNLPDDSAIADWFTKILNPNWQWFYGMVAAYGLRSHEVFQIDFSDFPVLTVLDGKTGRRRVWALYPEWCEAWNLNQVNPPKITGRNNSELSERASQYFRRGKMPFHLLDLRHCWAVRAIEFGLPIELAAQQMGHSVKTHTDLYHHWIDDRHHQRVYDLLMMRADRPTAPVHLVALQST
ncbi:hypothetical protein V2H45_05830 [Tumidithrix elongata RA019]|uniref:Tyr recombinase domain-containing protein n=1 Tax=Tumidithrix elongata BACA0141 TaxID=2716417 RepID=A0AAW9PYF3_9CYAN|nr:hypothetical protein [Tumidithrix elongata RA019]